MRKDKKKVTSKRPRREHAGGSPATGYESVSQEIVPVAVQIAMPPTPEEIDASMGLSEPGEADGNGDLTDAAEALVRITRWELEPFVRTETISGRTRTIRMKPSLSISCKVLCVQLALRPDALGFRNPSLDAIADDLGTVKQVVGRVFVDFQKTYPLFITRMMRRPEVKELYRQAHLVAQEDIPDAWAHEQLSLF